MHYLLALIVFISMPAYAASGKSRKISKSLGALSSISSSSDSSVAKPKLTFELKPRAAKLTDHNVATLLEQYTNDNNVVLSDPLQKIKVLGIHGLCESDPIIMNAAQHTLVKITEQKDIAAQRSLALTAIALQQTITTRLETWQAYHMGIMSELKPLIEDSIPHTFVDITQLSITYNSIERIALTPTQIDRLHIHVVAYALMLSELETFDAPVFGQLPTPVDIVPHKPLRIKSSSADPAVKKCILQ